MPISDNQENSLNEASPPIFAPLDVATGAPIQCKWHRMIFARLVIGIIVIICAEVFSGASLHAGLWHPWTLLVTYWLYFAHFFFFTTLAIRTGRTSLSSLYLWGILYGLYEAWITKVIWHGYDGDGRFIMGHIGPFGLSEMSMVFLYHPVMSFILPIAIACLLCPSLRSVFPDLVFFTAKSRGARWLQCYLIFSLAPVMAMNSGGPINLAANLVFVIFLLFVFLRIAKPCLVSADARPIIAFGKWGFIGLCFYLALLYGVTYFKLRPEGLPSAGVQLFTILFYVITIVGLRWHRKREAMMDTVAPHEKREMKLVISLFIAMIAIGLVLSFFAGNPLLYLPIALNFAIWSLLGYVLTAMALARGFTQWRQKGK